MQRMTTEAIESQTRSVTIKHSKLVENGFWYVSPTTFSRREVSVAKYLIKKQRARKIEKIFKVKFILFKINFFKLKNKIGIKSKNAPKKI